MQDSIAKRQCLCPQELASRLDAVTSYVTQHGFDLSEESVSLLKNPYSPIYILYATSSGATCMKSKDGIGMLYGCYSCIEVKDWNLGSLHPRRSKSRCMSM